MTKRIISFILTIVMLIGTSGFSSALGNENNSDLFQFVQEKYTLAVGEERVLTAYIPDSSRTDLKFSMTSSAPSFVDTNDSTIFNAVPTVGAPVIGRIKGVSPGEADVTISCSDGVSKTCRVIVLDNNPWSADGTMIENRGEATPSGNDWWAEAIGAYDAWAYVDAHSTELADVTVGIIDSGFDVEHEELIGMVPLQGYEENTPDDHGTHVAGIIAAQNNNEGIRGIADTASILYVDFEHNNCINAITEMVQSGVCVINNSWGKKTYTLDGWIQKTPTTADPSGKGIPASDGWRYLPVLFNEFFGISSEFAQFAEEKNREVFQSGIITLEAIIILLSEKEDSRFLIVQSSGNGLDNGEKNVGIDSLNTGFMGAITEDMYNDIFIRLSESSREFLSERGITYQTIKDHIVIVGAVTNEKIDNCYKLRPSSNFGDGVEICAPGEGVFSTVTKTDDKNPGRTSPDLDGKLYGEMSGTSMAAPMVSAAAALLWQVNPDLTAAEVKDILMSCNPSGAVGVTGEDAGRTYPMLNVGMAVEEAARRMNANQQGKQDRQNVDYSLYIPVLESIASLGNKDDHGLLYDMDGDGVQELILLYQGATEFFDFNYRYSIYDIENEKLIAKKDKEYLFSEIDGSSGKIGIVNYHGKAAFLTLRNDYGVGSVDVDYIYVYDCESLSEIANFKREGIWGFSQERGPEVNEHICSINGNVCSYDEYQREMAAIEEVDMLYVNRSWRDQMQTEVNSMSIPELLKTLYAYSGKDAVSDDVAFSDSNEQNFMSAGSNYLIGYKPLIESVLSQTNSNEKVFGMFSDLNDDALDELILLQENSYSVYSLENGFPITLVDHSYFTGQFKRIGVAAFEGQKALVLGTWDTGSSASSEVYKIYRAADLSEITSLWAVWPFRNDVTQEFFSNGMKISEEQFRQYTNELVYSDDYIETGEGNSYGLRLEDLYESILQIETENVPRQSSYVPPVNTDGLSSETDASTIALTPEDISITFESSNLQTERYEYATITAHDTNGKAIWTYTTKEFEQAQLPSVKEIGVYRERYYFYEYPCVVAVDLQSGETLWRNEDFHGSNIGNNWFCFGEDGTLYLCGYLGPDFCAIDWNGNTLCRIAEFPGDYMWATKMHWEGDYLIAVNLIANAKGHEYGGATFYVDTRTWAVQIVNTEADTPSTAAILPIDDMLSLSGESITAAPYYGSLYGAHQVSFVGASASSEYVQGSIRFIADYAISADTPRPWVEGVAGDGEGESLTLYFEGEQTVDVLALRLGYASRYETNNRPRVLDFEFSDGSTLRYEFADLNEDQYIRFSQPVTTTRIKITIVSVYPSYQDNDTCITEVRAYRTQDSSSGFITPSFTMGPFYSGQFSFVNGASIMIPSGFADTNTSGDYQSGMDVDGYMYNFYDSEHAMWIMLSEAKVSAYAATGRYGYSGSSILLAKYNDLISLRGTPTWSPITDSYFKLTGYSGSSIYYTYAVLDVDTIYIIDFLYPTANRSYCDRIVETTEASFLVS